MTRRCFALAACMGLLSATAASAIDLAGLSRTVGACEDFYTYANEGWLAATEIPADRAYWGVFAEIRKRNDAIIKDALARTLEKNPYPAESAMAKAADYFASGMNEAAIEADGLTPIRPLLRAIDDIQTRPQLFAVLQQMHDHNLGVGFELAMESDPKDRTRYLPTVQQSGMGLPERDYYFRSDAKTIAIRKAYVELLARLFEAAGEANAPVKAGRVLAFETQLAERAMRVVEMRDPKAVYNLRSVATLSREAPGFDWRGYFAAIGLGEPGNINVRQPRFATRFAALAGKAPLDDWQLVLKSILLREAAPRLPRAFEAAHFAFYGTALEGRTQPLPRDERVIRDLSGNYGDAPLSEALGRIFLEQAGFTQQSKDKAVAMVEAIRATLRERIQGLDWMGAATKLAALKKLDRMVLKIGYPDRFEDYAALAISRSHYAANWLAAERFASARNRARHGKPVDRGYWWMAPHTVNAYAGEYNEIVFPAGILQPPFFDAKADDAVNFGGIGMVIGHEITHHFDDQGRQFDENGNLREWWTKEDARRYQARAAAIATQFDGYSVLDGLKLNGKLTLGENIADLGGLTIAHLALRRVTPADAPKVDGFTPEQRFFLAFAQGWREKTRPESLRQQVQSDPHAPPVYRVLGPLANTAAFAEAFQCNANAAALRPAAKRTVIW